MAEEFFVVLIAPAERDIVIGVFAGASVPIGAHLRQRLRIHLVVFFEMANSGIQHLFHAQEFGAKQIAMIVNTAICCA